LRIIVSNSSNDPLYLQIAKQIKESILKGELTAGTALPSMRTLAKELQISVITTKHAYEKLEREGFIETVTGKGSFISMQNKELLREKELSAVEEKLAEVVAKSRLLNIDLDQLQEMLRLLWEEM
jgi:GntR family transcriptional regulator